MMKQLTSKISMFCLACILALITAIAIGVWAIPAVWAAPGDLSGSTKAVDRAVARTGDVLTYQIVLRNDGDPTGVRLSDPIPGLTTYVAGSATGGAFYDQGTDTVYWIGTLDSGDEITVTFQVTVQHKGTLGWPSVINTATIEDLVTGETITRTATTRINRPDMSPSVKTVDKAFAIEGERLHYSIVLSNDGTADADSVVLTDTLPANTEYVPGSGWASKGDFLGFGLMWTGPISVGESVTVTFDVTVAGGTLRLPIINTAQIDDGMGTVITRSVTTIANPWRLLLPIIVKRYGGG